ncbi:hypothetical protein Lesp02_03850 [Lentzea sp. NBRC 105346]|nr:hypothetical protein Lesp02_03850 [Lentzea sp. NBRC 105346]
MAAGSRYGVLAGTSRFGASVSNRGSYEHNGVGHWRSDERRAEFVRGGDLVGRSTSTV